MAYWIEWDWKWECEEQKVTLFSGERRFWVGGGWVFLRRLCGPWEKWPFGSPWVPEREGKQLRWKKVSSFRPWGWAKGKSQCQGEGKRKSNDLSVLWKLWSLEARWFFFCLRKAVTLLVPDVRDYWELKNYSWGLDWDEESSCAICGFRLLLSSAPCVLRCFFLKPPVILSFRSTGCFVYFCKDRNISIILSSFFLLRRRAGIKRSGRETLRRNTGIFQECNFFTRTAPKFWWEFPVSVLEGSYFWRLLFG